MRTVTAVPTRRSLASANGSLIMISSAASGAGARPCDEHRVDEVGRLVEARAERDEPQRRALDARDPAVGHPRGAHVGQRRHGGDEPGLVGGHLHPHVVEADRVGEAGVGPGRARAERHRAQHQARDQPEQHAEQQEGAQPGAALGGGHRAHGRPRHSPCAGDRRSPLSPPAPGRLSGVRVADRHPAADLGARARRRPDPQGAADRAEPVGHVREARAARRRPPGRSRGRRRRR